jgi:glycine/D-amino acid oxidase-like deaminating enzyme
MCDIVICGGGISGLWLLNLLSKIGFNVVLIEADLLGGTQTMASQGMIHGGQRYMLGGKETLQAAGIAQSAKRWDACLRGQGDIDLRSVSVLSDTQVMWPAGGPIAVVALLAAVRSFNTRTRKLREEEIPAALAGVAGLSVYELPEKVIDVASLVQTLKVKHSCRIFKGTVDSISSDGTLVISGRESKAQSIICAAGVGNEGLLKLLKSTRSQVQQRPVRQIMVKSLPFPLYGHGITANFRPRVTVTSHPLSTGGYCWYLGGALAEHTSSLTDGDAIKYAKLEMKSLFSHIDWSGRQWSTWCGVRAEADNPSGRLPDAPVVKNYGRVMIVWPTKLTLAPVLGDVVLSSLEEKGIQPKYPGQCPTFSGLERPPTAAYPWEESTWLVE